MVFVLSIAVFLSVIMLMVLILFLVEKYVVAAGDCDILINGDESKKQKIGRAHV